MKGVADIIGHDLGGVAVYAEIKTTGDRLSQDQINFMNNAAARDCRVYIVLEESGQAVMQTWEAYRGITG
jgi:hypothetical protein